MFSICLLSSVQAREALISTSSETAQMKLLNDTKAVVGSEIGEIDYYSDIDREFEKKTEAIRSVENWMTTAVIAISLIGSLVIIITLMHFRSRKISGLMYLL